MEEERGKGYVAYNWGEGIVGERLDEERGEQGAYMAGPGGVTEPTEKHKWDVPGEIVFATEEEIRDRVASPTMVTGQELGNPDEAMPMVSVAVIRGLGEKVFQFQRMGEWFVSNHAGVIGGYSAEFFTCELCGSMVVRGWIVHH